MDDQVPLNNYWTHLFIFYKIKCTCSCRYSPSFLTNNCTHSCLLFHFTTFLLNTIFSPAPWDSISLLLSSFYITSCSCLSLHYLISLLLHSSCNPPLVACLLSIPIAWLRSCMLTYNLSSGVHPLWKWEKEKRKKKRVKKVMRHRTIYTVCIGEKGKWHLW